MKVFLERVSIRNYKSIDKCVVRLGQITALVGRNGAGKSNFLDAIRFVGDCLQTSMDHAIKSRGGLEQVRRRSTGHPRNFGIRLDIILGDWTKASFAFEVASRPKGGFAIKQETLSIIRPDGSFSAKYRVEEGQVKDSSHTNPPPAVADRLYLVTAAGLPEIRPVFDALTAMGFYSLNPEAIKELQSPDAGELLHRDGSNAASVLGRLSLDSPEVVSRLAEYLEGIVPGLTGVDRISLGPKETLEFKQRVKGSPHPWKFYASSMSDGTLRVLGTLLSVAQLVEHQKPVHLVGIEEPEAALHPAAAQALVDALTEAASNTQIVVTSHSPELIDRIDIERYALLVVVSEEGTTRIATVDTASRQAIKNHLFAAGELLRMDQLEPDRDDLRMQEQMELFDSGNEHSE